MDTYTFYLRPEDCQPSGSSNISRYRTFEKNYFNFSNFSINQEIFKRKYINDWNELREFKEYIGLNDIELINNELLLINLNYKKEFLEDTSGIYNILRIMSGFGGMKYST